YIERALLPFSEIAKSDDSNLSTVIDSLIKRNVSAMMLADIGTMPHGIKERDEQWVKKGGMLVRFAGPRLEKGGDDLLPVPLRLGGRTLGGALSWATPQPLAPFGDDSLFAGLTPPTEVLVNKQVLADPAGLGPEVKVWARLKDGTPRALNLMTPKSLLKPLPTMPMGVERRVYEGDTAQPIKPQLLTIALALLFADIVAVLLLQAGGLLFGRRAERAGTAVLAALA